MSKAAYPTCILPMSTVMSLTAFLRECSSSCFYNLLKLEAKLQYVNPLMWRNHSAEGQNSMTFSKSPGLTCMWHLEKLAVKAYHFKKEASPSNAGLAKRIYNLSSHTSVGDNLTPHIEDATQARDKLRRQRIYWLTRICLYQSCFAGSCNTAILLHTGWISGKRLHITFPTSWPRC